MTSISWKNAVSGDWATPGYWTPAQVPGAGDEVTIAATGSPFTVTIDSAEAAHSLTLDSADATVALNNTLTLGGTLSAVAGTFDVNSGGEISGGTIEGNGLVFAGGALSGVTVAGPLDLSAAGGLPGSAWKSSVSTAAGSSSDARARWPAVSWRRVSV